MPIDINLGRIAAYVRLDFSKLEGDKRKAQKSIKDFAGKLTKEVGESFSSLGQKMSLGITAPLLALGKGAVEAAKDMDSLRRGLTAITGSSAEAEKQFKRLKEVAKLPGLGFKEAVEGAINLQAAGFSAKQAEKSMMAFGNALATMGKGKAELREVIVNLQQMASAGKVTADEIKETAQRVPQLRKAMENVFGTSNTELIQKAGITGKQFVEVISNELLKLPKVTGGVQNAFENFQDSMQQSLAEIGKAILPDLIKAMKQIEEGVKSFIGWWKQLPDATRQNIIHFAEFVALIGPMTLLIGSVAGAVGNLTAAFAALKTATIFLRTPGGLIGAGVVGAGAVIAKVVNDLNNAISQGRKQMYQTELRERTSRPREYWEKQIREARQRMEFARTNPLNNAKQRAEQIANNQNAIANAERQLKADIKARMHGPDAPPLTAQEMQQEMLQKQLRAQIAAGQQEAAARKAEAAARKAAAERRRNETAIERARRIVVGRNTAEVDLFAGNERQGKAVFDAWLADMAEAAEAAWKADFKAMGRDMAHNMQNVGESILASVAQRGREATKAAATKRMMAKTSSFLGGASDALSGAMGNFGPLMEKAVEVSAQKRMEWEDRVARHSLIMGTMTLEQEKARLQKRLSLLKEGSEEFMRTQEQILDMTRRIEDDADQKQQQKMRDRFKGWRNLAYGIQGAFQTAFADVLSGSKDFFSSFVDAFKNMLAQLLAAGLAAGLMNAIFGGGSGGFLGGLVGVFTGGFDNGANDSRAYRWGRDFSRHFSSGAMEQSRTRAMQGRGSMAAAGAGSVNVNVHFGGVVVNHPMDVQAIGEQIGQATRNALRRRV